LRAPPVARTHKFRQPDFVLTLRPERGVDAVRALRHLLKRARRSYGLRAISIAETRLGRRSRARSDIPAVGVTKMALGKRRGGDFLPILKFDARAGVVYTQDRVFQNGEWSSEQHDVTEGLVLIVDVKNIQQGWIRYPKGAPPEMALAPPGATDIGEAPSKEHKEGIRVLVKIPGDAAGTRELASTALGLYHGLDALHDQYAAEKDEHPGKVPLCKLVACHEKKLANGPSWEPEFHIIDWADRPNDMPLTVAAQPQPQPPKPKAKAMATADVFNDDIPY
jgi:hypothetical protein